MEKQSGRQQGLDTQVTDNLTVSRIGPILRELGYDYAADKSSTVGR